MDEGLETCKLNTFTTDLALPSDSSSAEKGSMQGIVGTESRLDNWGYRHKCPSTGGLLVNSHDSTT